MLNLYPPGVLGEEPGSLDPLFDNDVSSFFKAWNAIHDVMFACKGPGWVKIGELLPQIPVTVCGTAVFSYGEGEADDERVVGGCIGDMSGSIGVFIWSKFSAMDRRTPSGTINELAFNSSSLSTD